jgi:hypothetical protein
MLGELLERGPGLVVGSVSEGVVEDVFGRVAVFGVGGTEGWVFGSGAADALDLVVAEGERDGDGWGFDVWRHGGVAAGGAE